MDRGGNRLGILCGHHGNPLQMRREKRAMAWGIALLTGACAQLPAVSARSWIFLILSGLATGASWLCYYYAIQNGQVSVVVPIDRLSILVTVLFSLAVFREKLSAKGWIGLALLTAGTVCMAVFTG